MTHFNKQLTLFSIMILLGLIVVFAFAHKLQGKIGTGIMTETPLAGKIIQ